MGLTVLKGSVIGEHIDGTKHWIACPRCGEYNESGASKCRDCMTSFLESPRRRQATGPTVAISGPNFDAIWTELEQLTRGEELVWFQCPICSSLVDGAATHCVCGAIFEDPTERVSYACPLCNRKVSTDATQCRCGARFSD